MKIDSEEEMRAFGANLANELDAGSIVALEGPLGAGKTVLAQAIIAAFGYKGEVSSPSYALVHEYGPPDIPVTLKHADLYRLEYEEEFDELGLFDDMGDAIVIVEWASKVQRALQAATHRISIAPQPDSSRLVMINTSSD